MSFTQKSSVNHYDDDDDEDDKRRMKKDFFFLSFEILVERFNCNDFEFGVFFASFSHHQVPLEENEGR